MNRKKILILLNTAILSFTISTSVINFQKVEAKEPEVRIVEKEKMEDEIFKNKDYIGLVKSIGHAERLSEDKDAYIIYTKDSMNRLKNELQKARKVVNEKEKLTKKLVEDTRDSLELAIVELVKIKNLKPAVNKEIKPVDKAVVKPVVKAEVKPVDKAVVKPVDKAEVKPVVKAADKTEAKQKVKAEVKNIQELPKTGDFSSLPYVGGMVMSLVALMKLDRKNKKK